MIARTRATQEDGFSLVELLVVMVIIGVLAAIAVPVFINQRKAAVDTSMKSDLRNVAVFVESYFVDNDAYPVGWGVVAPDVETNPDTDFTLTVDAGGGGFCLVATRSASAPPGTGEWSYDSDGGGLLANHAACG